MAISFAGLHRMKIRFKSSRRPCFWHLYSLHSFICSYRLVLCRLHNIAFLLSAAQVYSFLVEAARAVAVGGLGQRGPRSGAGPEGWGGRRARASGPRSSVQGTWGDTGLSEESCDRSLSSPSPSFPVGPLCPRRGLRHVPRGETGPSGSSVSLPFLHTLESDGETLLPGTVCVRCELFCSSWDLRRRWPKR